MRNKIKVVFIINTITHYQLQFFNFLKRFLDIIVLFHSKNHINYEFSYQRKNFIYFIEDYKNKYKEYEDKIKPLITKLYGAVPPAGSEMFSGSGPPPFQTDGTSGPVPVDEDVD